MESAVGLVDDSPSVARGATARDADRTGKAWGNTVRVLLVEDDEVDRIAVRRALSSWPVVELVEAEEAGAALDALQREPFDCALVDFKLRGKNDGLDVIRAARKAGIRTPVVVLTAHGDEETAVSMMKAGASDYIPKSAFSAERLVQSLKNAMRLHRTELEVERTQLALQQSVAREQLARSDAELQRERLRSLFMQAPTLINIHRGPEHVFELVHPLTKKLFGNRPLEWLPLRKALPELEGQGFFEAFDRVYATGEAYFAREVHLKLDRGIGNRRREDAYFNFAYQPTRDVTGKIEGVMAVAVDVTETVLARQRVELLLAELRAAVRAREDLLAVVSHDLRNPVTVILSTAKMLLGADAPEKFASVRGQVDRIVRSADRMTGLISSLLDIAKLESGTLNISFETHEVRTIVDDTVELLAPLAHKKGIALESDVTAPLATVCDRQRLQQILANLVDNALKFTPAGGTVRVAAVESDGGVRFAVSDTGPGIPEENLPFIFERYWQPDTQKESGVGLGLSIVKGLVEAHGGRVWVESQPGAGSTFYFVLPPHQRASDASDSPVNPDANVDPDGILVVDDEADIRTAIAQVLEDRGYRVQTAANGKEALDQLRAGTIHPALILLDVMMPVMDGIAFRAEQEKDGALSDIPVVVFSAHDNVARTAMDLHAAAHLRKPLRAETLVETIVRVTGRAVTGSRPS
jgi:signal transduction histidine kinase/CheY-like chemotaxis protein